MPKAAKKAAASKGGRPAKFASEEALIDAIDEYLKYTQDFKELPNKAGLCFALHISRDTYSEYRKKYPDTIKAADCYIENAWVQRLGSPAATGAIFYLKNAFKETYKDRHETDITSGGKALPTPILSHVSGDHRPTKNTGA